MVLAADGAAASLMERQIPGLAELLLPSGPTTAADDAALAAYAAQATPDEFGDL